MRDSRLILEVRENKSHIQSENTGMEELATMCGALQCMIGMAAFRNGKSLDDVKTGMLEIYLAAMETLEEQARKE